MRHLKSFHIFHVAAQSVSFTQAAEVLCLTHGAVSKQIKVLEQYTGQQLFERQGRQMVLTQAGRLLKQYTDVAFQALEEGKERLQQQDPSVLEISCEPTLTMRWLMPRLDGFFRETGIDVRLSTAGGPVRLGRSGLSLAIRRDDFVIDRDYRRTVLVDEWIGPVCTVDYWRQNSQSPERMKRLHTRTRPHAWDDWLSRDNQRNLHSFGQDQHFEHFYFSLQAAADGLGIAMSSYPLIVDELKKGRLIAPYGFLRSGHRYVVLQLPDSDSQAESELIAWLTDQMSLCCPVEEAEGYLAP
ncbi:LysR family transcriptional regulator [Vibrio mangrovi]|uniref:Glycine cleavage system transcriptional activator n=1 Tax=Vibrio mangrovi TaxID=474394 RepID=A0A1Y6IX79_9VIBR|nr:LysR family transcriptional regulator [Vibrio mangrovi]MDW6002762.1 LysR family transcriptional regulator [Vibrio mangrovi]SMS02254.1 Glycine cleavage system transcriptional activator [Vibrio mangrovi]